MSDVLRQILRSFDDAWTHDWESVRYALRGLTSEEAQWQHPAYRDVEIIVDEQLPGSVLWHIVHVEQCERQYLYMTLHRTKPPEDTRAHPHSGDVNLMLASMEETHQALRNAITTRADADLELTISAEEGSRYNGMPVAEFLNVVTRHNSWHAGQIMVARRLYKERNRE